jgi:hypothetical protein
MKLQCPPVAPVLPVAMIRDFGTSRFRRGCGQNTPLRAMEEGQKADVNGISRIRNCVIHE